MDVPSRTASHTNRLSEHAPIPSAKQKRPHPGLPSPTNAANTQHQQLNTNYRLSFFCRLGTRYYTSLAFGLEYRGSNGYDEHPGTWKTAAHFGTHDSLSEASTFIEVIEKRQGLKVACLEGIALRHGWITADKMRELAKPMLKNQYGQYLLKVIQVVQIVLTLHI